MGGEFAGVYREIEARSKVDSSKTEGRCRTAEADRPSTSATSMPDHLHLCLEVHPTLALTYSVKERPAWKAASV